jgi:hypothetical protein
LQSEGTGLKLIDEIIHELEISIEDEQENSAWVLPVFSLQQAKVLIEILKEQKQ